MARWLAAVTNVFWDQASAGVASSRIGDQPGFRNKSTPHIHVFQSIPSPLLKPTKNKANDHNCQNILTEKFTNADLYNSIFTLTCMLTLLDHELNISKFFIRERLSSSPMLTAFFFLLIQKNFLMVEKLIIFCTNR